jgi:hypothetical protein
MDALQVLAIIILDTMLSRFILTWAGSAKYYIALERAFLEIVLELIN